MAFELPRTLSPSKASAFTDCPLAFRYSIIDHLPEPPSPHAVKGTLVHAALERLFWEHPAGDRTVEAALEPSRPAWDEPPGRPEFVELGLDIDEAERVPGRRRGAAAQLLPDRGPQRGPHGRGGARASKPEIGDMVLRGIIDRLDLTEDGELVVVDYKTGRAPSAQFEQARLNGVHTYALLCEQVLGRFPAR